MTETTYSTHNSNCSIRFSQSNAVEPSIDPVMAAWDLVTDFENWTSWFPKLLSVVRLDPGDPGRGSVLRLDYGNRSEEWTISYWEPLTQIDFISDSRGARVAYSYNMNSTHDNSHLDLELDMEIEFTGYRKLLSPVLTWVVKRNGELMLESLRIRLLSMVS